MRTHAPAIMAGPVVTTSSVRNQSGSTTYSPIVKP